MAIDSDILQFLNNNCNIIGNLEKLDIYDEWIKNYPQLENGYLEYTYQYAGENYTLKIMPNMISQRIYYSIFNSYNEREICFMPLVQYPLKLADGLYFYNNNFYLEKQ